MILRIVKRAKKGNALDMVEMKMAEENVSVDRPAAELLLKLVSEKAESGPAIENKNLIRVGSDFDTRSVAANPHVFFLWCGSRAANPPEPNAHFRPLGKYK